MNDEDIQYLGRRSPLGTSPMTPGRQQRDFVTGFILHVEKSASEGENELVFWRSDHNVIHIGRRPANPTTTESSNGKPDNAMFRCAVVSRKHAKIVFSDSGTVYIVDTNSHHGTHILKSDSASPVSKQIPPETPTQLSNGDIITFGKTVGRSNEFVTPIVARVELMYAPRLFSRPLGASTPIRQTSNQDKTIDLTLLSTPPPTVSPLFRRPPTVIASPMRRTGSGSGRYGLNSDFSPLEISSSSSSESEDEFGEHEGEQDMSPDSDVEEIAPCSNGIDNATPASGPNALPILRPRVHSFGSGQDHADNVAPRAEVAPPSAAEGPTSRMHKAFEIFEVLRNLIPPVNLPGAGPAHHDLDTPPSPPHELMAQRDIAAQELSQDNEAEVSSDPSVQQAQISQVNSMYRPHTPVSPSFTSPPMRLHIEPTSRPSSAGFPKESQQAVMYDIFDAPSTPPAPRFTSTDFSPFYSPYSTCGGDFLASPCRSPPAVSPPHSPPHIPSNVHVPDVSNPISYSFQPDSIFTQGFLDKERERVAVGDVVEQVQQSQHQGNDSLIFSPVQVPQSSLPAMNSGGYESFQGPNPEFVHFEWERQPSFGLPIYVAGSSADASSDNSALAENEEDEEAEDSPHAKDREDSPMELESNDGDNLSAEPVQEATSESAADQTKKRLTLSERLTLEREELERRLKNFRRVTSSEDRDEGVDLPEPPAMVSITTSIPELPAIVAPSMSANKAMSLDSICSSDAPAVVLPQASSPEPSKEEEISDDDEVDEVDELKEQIQQLQDDVQKAQAQQRRTRTRLARSLRAQSEKMSTLDDKVDDALKQCVTLGERLDIVTDMDMPDLVGQVEMLVDLVESKNAAAVQDLIEKNHDGLEKERMDVMEHVEMLKTLVDEMRQLKDETEEQMKAELDAVRLAKEEAIKAIDAHVKAQLAQTPSPASAATSTTPMNPVSLKRKRNDDGEDDECEGDEAGDEGPEMCCDEDESPAMSAGSQGSLSPPSSPLMVSALTSDPIISSPPRKRARTIATTAAKTATAVTVGAIAAWSALAFS